jgi:hypothetical protein
MGSKGVNFPKVELKKFDGTKVFTWVNQVEKYFELHNIMNDKIRISLATLYFEIKSYHGINGYSKGSPMFIIILGLYLQET